MKKIIYKTLSIQNFLSIGNDAIEIDFSNGLHLITGNNIDNPERKNGAGKSALIEGFYYALFGTTIRTIKKEFVTNNITRGAGNISLTFDVVTSKDRNSYKIVRTLRPSAVTLYKTGVSDDDISKDSIANTNKYICDLIGTNPSICRACDIFSLSDNVPFMGKKSEDKRKFIEDVFVLEIFGKMMKELKDKIKDTAAEYSNANSKLSEIIPGLNTLQDQYDAQKRFIEERDILFHQRKEELENRIAKAKEREASIVTYDISKILRGIEKAKTSITTIEDDINLLVEDSNNKKNQFAVVQSDIQRLTNIGSGKCPKCMQDITEDHIGHIQEDLEEKQSELEILTTNIKSLGVKIHDKGSEKKKLETALSILESKAKEHEESTRQLLTIGVLVDEWEDQLSTLERDMNDNSVDLDSFKSRLDEFTEKKLEQDKIVDQLRKRSKILDTCKFVIGDEGVKSVIVKRLLDLLNASIQKYIISLGMDMRCKFDEYFDEQMTDKKGKTLSYWNFSGAERRTIDIACAWAFKDTKRKVSGVSSNVEFIDEIFDYGFDEHGLDLLINATKERQERDSLAIYTISHRKETSKHIDGETILVEKENGITRRIDIDK